MTRTAHDPVAHGDGMARLRAAADGIQRELEELDTAVVRLRAEWSGEARDAYDAAHGQWTTAMTRLRHDLGDIVDGATSAGHRLAKADADVAALWA